MKLVRNVLLGGLAMLILLVAVVAVRTATFAPAAATAAVTLPPPTPIDGARAAVRLGEAIRFRTVSNQDPAQNERAEWDRLHAWLQATYPRAHAAMTREVLAGHTLLYTWQGEDPALPPIVLMAHQDVVPVTAGTEGDWKQPPFSGALVGGAVWGRGAVDDEGSLVGLFEAAEALTERGFQPRRTVMFAFGHDEEQGGTGAQAVAATMKARGIRAQFVLDEGMLIIADHPVTGGAAATIGLAEKGYATLRVTAKAAGGHSSMPPAPEKNATVVLGRAVSAIADNPFPLAFSGPAREMMRGVAPDAPLMVRVAVANEWLFGPLLTRQIGATPAGAAMLHTTIAPTMLEGSPKENVLPQTATARINYRIHPDDAPADVLARAKAAVGDLPVTLAWESPPNAPSPVSSTTSAGWRVLSAVARESAGGAPVAPGLVLAATDSRALSDVAEDVYRFQPVRLTLAETGMIHGTNEHITVENLDRMAEFYARLISAAASR
jgi:carboxypeptidase PM20D1